MKKVLIGMVILGIIGGRTYIYKNHYFFYKYLPNIENEGQFKKINNKICLEKDIPFTGRIKNIKGNYVEIYSYKNGDLNGLSTVYYNDEIKEIGHWKDDKQNGVFYFYDKEGILVDKANFKDGMRNGLTEQFYEKTGKKRVKGEYRDNLKIGEWVQYYKNGNLQAKVNYIDDELNGEYKEYYENRKLKIEGKYKNNLPEGEWRYYSDEKNLLSIIRYKNGMLNGIKKDYYLNGVLSREMEFKDNLPYGKYKSYWENGSLQEIGVIVNDEYKEVKFYNPKGEFINEIGKNDYNKIKEIDILDKNQDKLIKKLNNRNI